jgi:preprotein translocase subunit YajC
MGMMGFITPALAQGAAAPGANEMIMQFLPLVAVAVIFYFLLMRPQQKRAKAQREMIANIRRGDTGVTSGGFIAKVTKVADNNELEVELADGVRVRVVRSMVIEVRSKNEPVKGGAQS